MDQQTELPQMFISLKNEASVMPRASVILTIRPDCCCLLGFAKCSIDSAMWTHLLSLLVAHVVL